MVKIDMDNGKRYTFGDNDYKTYAVTDQFMVVTNKSGAWVGCFSLNHMIGFFVEEGE